MMVQWEIGNAIGCIVGCIVGSEFLGVMLAKLLLAGRFFPRRFVPGSLFLGLYSWEFCL